MLLIAFLFYVAGMFAKNYCPNIHSARWFRYLFSFLFFLFVFEIFGMPKINVYGQSKAFKAIKSNHAVSYQVSISLTPGTERSIQNFFHQKNCIIYYVYKSREYFVLDLKWFTIMLITTIGLLNFSYSTMGNEQDAYGVYVFIGIDIVFA